MYTNFSGVPGLTMMYVFSDFDLACKSGCMAVAVVHTWAHARTTRTKGGCCHCHNSCSGAHM